MFVILEGHLAGEPGLAKIIVENAGPLPAAFVATAIVGTATTFLEAFNMSTGLEITA